ncbi:hypothetical protein P3342_011173 [Pyrenophora teres f. teres]|nr:hypothetical protein P3342_011173 [Pyrenophora teres f. teres]
MQSRPTIPPSSRPRSLLMEETDILQAKHLASILSENCFLLPFPDSAYGSREISPAISRTFELPTDNDSSKVEESSFALSHAPQHASNSCFEPKSLINSSHDEPGNQGLRDSELLEGDISKLPFYGVIGDGRPFTSIQAMATAVYVDKLPNIPIQASEKESVAFGLVPGCRSYLATARAWSKR